MIGAIAGDIIGSVYEFDGIKTKDFPLFHPRSTFTDDSVLTVAVASAILGDGDYFRAILQTGRRYPRAGWGSSFRRWLGSPDPKPYNSWGNGSAMRVSPVGFAFDSVEDVLREATRTAEISHDHPEGLKGAQATALSVYLARTVRDKDVIRKEISERFSYELGHTVDEIRPAYYFDESCQRTVPAALIAFLDSTSHEDAVRNAVSLGGDADTLACIAGGIAEAFYGPVSQEVRQAVENHLTDDLWEVTESFSRRYGWWGQET